MYKAPQLIAFLFITLCTSRLLAGESARFEDHWIASGQQSLRLYLRHLPARKGDTAQASTPVLFLHGSSFPSGLAAGYRFDGYSWMDDLSRRGFDVWALDFLGYGESDRYPEMDQPAARNLPLGRAKECAEQAAVAVDFILRQTKSSRVSLVAHSWGTIVAGVYASSNNSKIDRLVLFGPVAQRSGNQGSQAESPAWICVSAQEQRDRFEGYVPAGFAPVFDPKKLAEWGSAYMATDRDSGKRNPPCVEVPNGPGEDIEASWTGQLPYDPSRIQRPVLIVRGEWDVVTRNEDADWLFRHLTSAPLKRDVLISKATHVMHLENSRFQLYEEVATFLGGDAPID